MNWDDWRLRINELDNQILQLLTQRAEAALKIGDLKRRADAPVHVPEREAEILRRLVAANPGPLPAAAILAVWREVLSGCRALEAPLTVAYLGPQATFTHQAARERFGGATAYRPARSIAEVFDEVERGLAELGVVPVENSTEGAVNVTLDRLITSDAVISGELRLDIAQQLLSEAIAGELYGVPALRARIEDNPNNSTRFLVIGRRPVGPTGRDKTSILFAMRNEPGSLYRILEPLARAKINLTKIESRPARQGPWEYVIFVDLEGHRDTPEVAPVLAEIGERTLFLKVLGSYPAA